MNFYFSWSFGLRVFCILVLLPLSLSIQLGQSQNENSAFSENSVLVARDSKWSRTDTDIDFSIMLPNKWRGLDHGSIAMLSPDGINQFNGNLIGDENEIFMVIEFINISHFQEHKNGYNGQNYCKIISEKYLMINTAQSKEIFANCGDGFDQKIVNYIFGSGNKIIIVGLKGVGTQFDNNLDDFRKSVKTVMIENPTDIEQVPTSHNKVN